MAPTTPDVFFHFDPLCPWTWLTARWLAEVAEARSLTIGWRALSLSVVNGGDASEDDRSPRAVSSRALRLVEALAAAGDHHGAGRFYEALGTRVHRNGEPMSPGTVEKAAADAGVDDLRPVSDPAWGAAVEKVTRRAVAAAGDGVGSPILRWENPDRAVSGPVVSPSPTGADALRLWAAVEAMASIPGVYEIKRGRPDKPAAG